NHVGLVQEHDDIGYAYLTGQQDVLAGLRHRAVSSGADQDSAAHLSSTGDHVLHVVGVTGAVNVRVVTGRGIILNVGSVDGDTTSLLFRRVVDPVVALGSAAAAEDFGADAGQGCGQSGLAVVNVTDGAHVQVRFAAFELLFSHLERSSMLSWMQGASHATIKIKADICISALLLELMSGFEPLTSPLPRVCSTNCAT